jgi:uncharacterized delta-60 repeat protein
LQFAAVHAIDNNGRVLVAKWGINSNGLYRPFIQRLLTDGSIDPGFAPAENIGDDGLLHVIVESNNYVIAYRTGGAGALRLNEDGVPDESFAERLQPFSVGQILSLPNGKLLLALAPTNSTNGLLMRLESSGQRDTAFHEPYFQPSARIGIASQPDGRILVTGAFTNVDGFARNHVARLNGDGTVDITFEPPSDPPCDFRRVIIER